MNQAASHHLRGLRVLIAEDNWLIAESLEQILVVLGCSVVGPIAELDEVMNAIRADGVDAALLDIELGEASVLPAASELAARGIPFILTTGRSSLAGLPTPMAEAPHLVKPYDAEGLEAMMTATFLPPTLAAAAC